MLDVHDQYYLFYERGVQLTELGQYILSVVCCAFFCGILGKIQGNKGNSTIQLMIGLVMMITILQPVLKNKSFNMDISLDEITDNSACIVENAENAAKTSMASSIKEKTEEYILSYAREKGLDICVEIEVNNNAIPAPQAITIHGSLSPYSKLQLSEYIQTQLGISEENQIWIL